MELRDVIAQALSKIPVPQSLPSALSELVNVRIHFQLRGDQAKPEDEMMLADEVLNFVTAKLAFHNDPSLERMFSEIMEIQLARLGSPQSKWDYSGSHAPCGTIAVIRFNWDYPETIWIHPNQIRENKATEHHYSKIVNPLPIDYMVNPCCGTCGGLNTDEPVDPEIRCICPAVPEAPAADQHA